MLSREAHPESRAARRLTKAVKILRKILHIFVQVEQTLSFAECGRNPSELCCSQKGPSAPQQFEAPGNESAALVTGR
jgi:hypothetical protein